MESSDAEYAQFEVEYAQKERKVLLICSGIGLVIGIVIAIVKGGYDLASNIFLGIWFGIGIGGALTFIPNIPGAFKQGVKEEGFSGGIKSTLIGVFVWLLIFAVAGPIALLIRLLKKTIEIKKLQKKAAGGSL